MGVQGNGKSTHWLSLGLAWHTAISRQVCWNTIASPAFGETKPEGWRVPGQTRLAIPWPKTKKAVVLMSGIVPRALYFQKVPKTVAWFRPIMKTNFLNSEFGTETEEIIGGKIAEMTRQSCYMALPRGWKAMGLKIQSFGSIWKQLSGTVMIGAVWI